MANYNKIAIPFNGKLYSAEELSKICGISPSTIRRRIKNGFTASQCLSSDERYKQTLCWDCANACGGCSWSSREQQPVDGWDATPTKLRIQESAEKMRFTDSYIVHSCPQFVRDAKNGGHERL